MHTLQMDVRGLPRYPSSRRALICSLARVGRSRGGLVAFGLGDNQLRVVSHQPLFRSVRALLAQRGVQVSDWVTGEGPALEAAAWAHELGEGDPLSRVWTSHRDILGFRHAGWVEAWTPRAAALLHHRLHGKRLPRERTLFLAEGGAPSDEVLRETAALVTGRVRFDASCRGLVAALALDLGSGVDGAATASGLTRRRVRQIRQVGDSRVRSARATLADRRLQVTMAAAREARNRIRAPDGGTCSGLASVRSCSWSSWSSSWSGQTGCPT